MRVNFLGASDGTALSKVFEEIAPGAYKEDSYPNVAKFNSIERPLTTPYDFYTHVVAAAKEGLCLLKGQVDQPLFNQSRAGHTDSSKATEWLCLDVDYVVTDQTPAEWLAALSPEFADVSFIFQYSASHGMLGNSGWRGHFFVLLDSPQPPQVLKQWLIQRNLVCTPLRNHIGLSASGGALTYPLDITTCQNDKLIYIAPPKCIGFVDPLKERFELFAGTCDRPAVDKVKLDLSTVSAAANQRKIKELLADKRKTLGLEKKTFKVTHKYDTEVLTNPDPVTVSGKKEARDFVYLNLNGGDSWGYYFPIDNPEILYNFKGEPCMYMRDVDKGILNDYSKTIVTASGGTADAMPFGFLWPDNDTYYRGFANPLTGELLRFNAVGSKGKLQDFFTQHGEKPRRGWVVHEWQLTFDPTVEGGVDFAQQEVNTYKQTSYILNAKHDASGHIPPTIDRVLSSVCVDEQTKQHFLNWLSAIFQTRVKTNTAWIFQGVQGTGKGVLLTHIITPLLGRDYCHEMTMDRLDDNFNAYLEDNIILFIDEAKISDSRDGDRLLNRVKNLVTEPQQHIRGMRRNAVTRDNYSNIILASNYDEIIPMEASDRRFNVAPRQEKPIQLDYDDIFTIEAELDAFANFLHSYEVDHKQVRQVLLSAAREQLIELSETTVTAFFHAVTTGDLAYFSQYLDNSIKSDLEGIRYHDYALVVGRWMSNANLDGGCNVSRNELRTCYQFLQNNTISVSKFSRMSSKYGCKMVPVRIDGVVSRGLNGVQWHLTDEEKSHHEEQQTDNVIHFNKEKK